MAPTPRQTRYDGVHCTFVIERVPGDVVVVRISGTDIGELADAPMIALNNEVSAGGPVDLFIDARDVRGASIEVSGEWASWLSSHKESLRAVTMLTGSRFVQITAEFVRRFANLEGVMRICTESTVFDRALSDAMKS